MSLKKSSLEGFYVFEVFSQKNPTASFVHQFSLSAPNHEMALVLAKENFLRRDEVANLWIVQRDDIYVLPPEDRHIFNRLNNKQYRETKGYGDLQSRWRHHRENYERGLASKPKSGGQIDGNETFLNPGTGQK